MGDTVPLANPHPQDVKVEWPYKYLWNVLRGESIVADDEVILEELRTSFDKILLALTQFPFKPTPTSDDDTSPKKVTTTTTTSAPPPEGATPAPTLTFDNEKKLKKRISLILELEEGIAWDVFCTYIMFEYKGGSTSFESLLSSPRVSTDFLTDLQHYYGQERVSVLLVIQALFGYLSQLDHKYNHIFQTFREWMKEKDAVSKLLKNLLLSLDQARNWEEEVHVLHALIAFIYHLSDEGILEFCKEFKSFKPGRKAKKVLMAEAALMFSLMNFPLWLEAECQVPMDHRTAVAKVIEEQGDELLINEYTMGAVLGGFFGTARKNEKVKKILGQDKHQFQQTFTTMLELVRAYSPQNVENKKNNLSNVVLKSVFYALRTVAEGFTENRIFKCGSRDTFYELASILMENAEIAALLCADEGTVLQWTVSTAMMDFPLKLKNVCKIWGSLCFANARFPNQSIPLLKDCCKMVTTLAERTINPDDIKAVLELNANEYKLLEPRVVAGIQLPSGTELDRIVEDPVTKICTMYWRIPNDMVLDVFQIINNEILIPLASQMQNAVLSSTPINELVSWVRDEDENILSILKFLVKYASCSSAITESLRQLYEPMGFIAYKTIDLISNWKVKSELCSLLMELLVAANRFGAQGWSHVYFSDIWPTRIDSASYTSEIIMGYESISNSECLVTISLLQSIDSFFKEITGLTNFSDKLEEKICYNAVDFVNENVFHSFTRWRFNNLENKYKILLHCLKLYSYVLDVQSDKWSMMKTACAKSLLAPHSSLMTVLSTSEDVLQMSVLQPTQENYLIPEIIYRSLAVLLKLFHFQKDTIKLVDETLGSTLVQRLARFARHRMDYKIPTLAMALLKKIAEEINMSLLSCLGSEEVAFRDLISQRLEFRSEDVNLKISILEFLSVAAHTQPGLTQNVFTDDFLAQKIVDLPTEKDEGLALAVLCFLRALFRKGAVVMKKCQNLWENLFHPINQLQPHGRLKIATCTLNIASLELFRFGMANSKFAAQVKCLVKEENFVRLLEVACLETGEPHRKCLLAFKHFIIVVLHRNDMEEAFTENTKRALLDIVTTLYWNEKDDEKLDPQIHKVRMDLMCQLLNSITDSEYISKYFLAFCDHLSKSFVEDSVPVQISALTLANICVKKVPKEQLVSSTLEPILRVIVHVFDNACKIFKHLSQNVEAIGPLITLSATLLITILKTVDPKEWQKLFHRYAIPHAVVHAVHEGIEKCQKEDIMVELLYVLLKMAEVKECAEALSSGLVIQRIFLVVLRNAERTAKDIPLVADSTSFQWSKIYLVTLQFVTQLLRTEGIHFVEHSLNLWGNHGGHMIEQLNSMPLMTSACKMNQPDYNLRMMKTLLTFNVYGLDSITAMIPFWKYWTLNNSYDNLRVLNAVYTAMQTSINLLDQPHYLQSFIVYGQQQLQSKAYVEMRPTPQLLDLQERLWDIVHVATYIFWTLRNWSEDVVESPKLLASSNQLSQSCVKALSKPERKQHPSGGYTQPQPQHITANAARILDTLERALSLYLYHGKKVLDHPALTLKQKQNIIREISSDAATLCDGARRIILTHPSILLERLCYTFECEFNVPADRVPSRLGLSRQDSSVRPPSATRPASVFRTSSETPHSPTKRGPTSPPLAI